MWSSTYAKLKERLIADALIEALEDGRIFSDIVYLQGDNQVIRKCFFMKGLKVFTHEIKEREKKVIKK